MDLLACKRLSKALFYVSAMVSCFGLGFYLMGHEGAGIAVLIAGVSGTVASFSVIKFFALMSIRR